MIVFRDEDEARIQDRNGAGQSVFPDPARMPMLRSGPLGAVTTRRIAQRYFAGTAGPRGPYVFTRIGNP